MNEGYEVAHIDELEELPINDGEFVWRPIRRRFGITAFGTNAYTAQAGQRVIEEHNERGGHEEMYVVLRGRATFALGDDEGDVPAGTIVFVRPDTKRGAIRSAASSFVAPTHLQPGLDGRLIGLRAAESQRLARAAPAPDRPQGARARARHRSHRFPSASRRAAAAPARAQRPCAPAHRRRGRAPPARPRR